MAKKYEIDMCRGPILPGLLRLVVPLMISSVLQLLFNAADIIVVGNFASENSLAAVGSTSALVNLMTNLFLGLSTGANVLCARYKGADDSENVSKTIHTSMFLALACGAILTAVGVIFAEPLLLMMETPEEVLPLSALYLRIYFLGSIAMLIYNFGSSVLRSKGDTKRPLYYLAGAGVINVGLNLIFVMVLHMDVAGVALATVISQCVSAILVVVCLMREEDAYRFRFRLLRPSRRILARILQIGLPAGLQGVVFSLSNVVVQSSINSFGPIVMAGSAASASIEGFVWVSMNAFSQGALTFTSQNVGGGKYSRINKIALISCSCAALAGLLFGGLAVVFGRSLLSVYDPRPEILDPGMIRLSIVCGFYFVCGLMDCIVGSIRGMGYAVTPTVVSMVGACGLRILWIATVFQMFHTEAMLYISYPVTWGVTFIAHLICYILMRRKYPREDR